MAEQQPRETEAAPYIPLPSGLRTPRATGGRVFDNIAALYDRSRPGYPEAALRDLVQCCDVTSSSRVLEIGCGTGQLTRDLAATGAAIRCVEPGAALAKLARANLAHHPNVEVVTTRFEDLEDAPQSYDVAVSATAFHWIDPSIAYAKAADLVRPGGWLALMTNTHASGGTHTDASFAESVRQLHRRLAPEVGEWTFPSAPDIEQRAAAGGDIAVVWARLERKLGEPPAVSHLFHPPSVNTYRWLASYDKHGYLAMLASQSSYALMEPERRAELLETIGRLIDEQLSGPVTKQYVTVVALAERRHLGI